MHEPEHNVASFRLPAPVVIAGVAAVTLLGLLVRLYGLTSYGLWFDEAYHIELVKLPGVGAMLDAVLSNPPSDPLYVLTLRGWVTLFGHTTESVRVLSVIFGTATIPATFLLGRYALGSAVGLWGAFFFAVSPYAIELGQEAALYALAALLTTLALAVGWRWLRTERGVVLYAIVGGLAIYSHYVVAVILTIFAALVLMLILRDRKRRERWTIANGLIILAWLPWLMALIIHWLGSDLLRASLFHPASFEEVIRALIQFTSGTASLQQGQRWLWVAGLASGVILLLGSWCTGARGPVALLISLFALIFLAPALVSVINGMWLFVPHFMLFLLPALFVSLCAALGNMPTRAPAITRVALVVALVVWIGVQSWGIVLYNRYPPHGADGLRELASRLTNDSQPSDAVFVTPPALMATLRQYYGGEMVGLPEDFDLRRVYLPYDPSDWQTRSLANIASTLGSEGSQRFWLVYRPELDDGGQLLRSLEQKHSLVSDQPFDYGELFLFMVEPTP